MGLRSWWPVSELAFGCVGLRKTYRKTVGAPIEDNGQKRTPHPSHLTTLPVREFRLISVIRASRRATSSAEAGRAAVIRAWLALETSRVPASGPSSVYLLLAPACRVFRVSAATRPLDRRRPCFTR